MTHTKYAPYSAIPDEIMWLVMTWKAYFQTIAPNLRRYEVWHLKIQRKLAKLQFQNPALQNIAVKSCVASCPFVSQKVHMIDNIANRGRQWRVEPVLLPVSEEQTVTPLVLVWRCQIRKWSIVIILEPFPTTITHVIAHDVTYLCPGHNSSHFEMKLNDAFCTGVAP